VNLEERSTQLLVALAQALELRHNCMQEMVVVPGMERADSMQC